MKDTEEFYPSESRFNDGRSTLSDFVQGQAQNLPNEIKNGDEDTYHDRPAVLEVPAQGAEEGVGHNAIASSRKHTAALENGTLRGEEHYTEHTDTPAGLGHGQEGDQRVESRMISKEEFPQG